MKKQIDPSKISENRPNTSQPDLTAIKEDDYLSNQKRRDDEAKTYMHKSFLLILKVSTWLVVVVISVRVLHYILPVKCQWLTLEQMQAIDKTLFSGAIGGFIAKYFGKLNS